MQYPIANDCLKVSIFGHHEPHMVKKLLLPVLVRELHNRMVSNPEDSGLNMERYVDNNIIINSSTLRLILQPQLKNMSARYNIMCGCECCIYAKIIHSSLLSQHGHYLKNLKDLIQNAKKKVR